MPGSFNIFFHLKFQDHSSALPPVFLCPPGPVLMSLKPGSQEAESYSQMSKGRQHSLDTRRCQSRPGMLQLSYIQDKVETKDDKEDGGNTKDERTRTPVSNGEDLDLCSPPRTENEVPDVILQVLFSKTNV